MSLWAFKTPLQTKNDGCKDFVKPFSRMVTKEETSVNCYHLSDLPLTATLVSTAKVAVFVCIFQ
jgi:hypothetical protein